MPGHFRRLRDAHHSEQRGCDIGQCSTLSKTGGTLFRNEDQGHGIGRVGSVRTAGLGVDHQLRIAVVGGDDHSAAFRSHRLVDFTQAGVHGFNGFGGGFELAAVAHHVGVGEVHDQDIKMTFVHRFDHRVFHPLGAHLRLQVVGGHFGRRDQDAFLSGISLLDAAVEEVSDVRVFLCFRHAQVLEVQVRHDAGQDVSEFLRGNKVG